MHFFSRKFIHEFLGAGIRIFNNPDDVPEALSSDKADARAARKHLEALGREINQERQEQAAAEQKQEVAAQARHEQLEAMQEGEAKEYLNTFVHSPDFIVLAANLDTIKQLKNDPQDPYFYENWITKLSPEELARLFENPLFPIGRGKTKFLEGLRGVKEAPASSDKSQEAQAYRESTSIVRGVVAALRKHYEERRTSRETIDAQMQKTPFPDVIGDAVKTLKQNWTKSSGTEKLLTVVTIGLGLWLLNKYKDKTIFSNGTWKWSTLIWGAAGLYLGNRFIGQISADGKTAVQKLDFGRTIDDLNDTVVKGYAAEKRMGEKPKKLETFMHLQKKSVKQLFEVYQDAFYSEKRELNPTQLGFYKNEIDGAQAYEIIEDLVKDAAVNAMVEARREQGNFDRPTADEVENWRKPDIALSLFRARYMEAGGKFNNIDENLFEAALNEYGIAQMLGLVEFYGSRITLDRGSRLPDYALGRAKDITRRGVQAAEEFYYDKARPFVVSVGGKIYKFSRDKILEPIGAWTTAKWNRYAPKAAKPLKKALVDHQEKEIANGLPPKFAVEVTSPASPLDIVPKKGVATIMGFAGIEFLTKIRQDGKNIATIDGIDFDLDAGVNGNKKEQGQLEAKITQRAQTLLDAKAKSTPKLSGKTAKWDKKEKTWTWIVENVETDANPDLGLPAEAVDLTFKVSDDGKTLEFFDAKKKIDSFTDINEIHEKAVIEKAVWDSIPAALKPHLDGLPVEVISITPDAARGAKIEAAIAGLKFTAYPKNKQIKTGVDFDPALGQVKIEKPNGGEKFLLELTGRVFESDYFKGPFTLLQAQMENTSEGVLARIKEMNKTKLWIIPTNMSGLINGQILQQRWNYTLEFKMIETLSLFEHELTGKTLNDIPAAYAKFIQRAHKHLMDLSNYISTLPDEDIAKNFEKLMDGKASPPIPAGIEYLNYENEEYRQYFEKFQRMIKNPRYDYEGIDNWDSSAVKSANEIYQTLLLVWSRTTRKIMRAPAGIHLSGTEKQDLDHVITTVQNKLDIAAQKGKGVIKKDALPAGCSQNERDLDLWMK